MIKGTSDRDEGNDGGRDTGSLAKGLRILLELSKTDRGMKLSDLARACRFTGPTTHRLLRTLMEFGFVRLKPEPKTYYLGYRFFDFGLQFRELEQVIEAAKPFMVQLAAQTGHLVGLALLDDVEMVTIARQVGPLNVNVGGAVGDRMPLHTTAAGKAVLGILPRDDRMAVLSRIQLNRRTSRSIITHSDLERAIEKTIEQRYGVADEENDAGIRSIATAIVLPGLDAILALALSAPSFVVPLDQLKSWAPMLIDCAQAIANAAQFNRS